MGLTDEIKREHLLEHADDLEFDDLVNKSKELAGIIAQMVERVDAGMSGYGQAEARKLEKQIEGIKAKMVKQAKTKHESSMSAIEQIKQRLFPNGKLQERSTNFFSLSPDGHYEEKLSMLYNSIDPLENDFIIIRES